MGTVRSWGRLWHRHPTPGREGEREIDTQPAEELWASLFRRGPGEQRCQRPRHGAGQWTWRQVWLGQSLRWPVATDNVREKPHFPEKGLEVN